MGDLLKMTLRDRLLHLKVYCIERGACENCRYKFSINGTKRCEWMELKLNEAPESWDIDKLVGLLDGIDNTVSGKPV